MRATRLTLRAATAAVSFLLLTACSDEAQETDEPPDPTPTDVDYLTEARLGAAAEYLSSDELQGREPGTPGHALARAYIIEQLQACGVQPGGTNGYEQPITTGIGTNVIGTIAGTDPALGQRYVLVSGHYDHLGTSGDAIYNGAGDNAAAVAVVLGLACELAENPPARSVIIAAWDCEEPPYFLTDRMGSEFYAANPTTPLDTIDATFVLESIGLHLWPGSQVHLVFGAEYSPELAASIDAAAIPDGLIVRRGGLHLVEEMPYGMPKQRWSDYAAFVDRGRPTVMLIDGPNKQYHTPEDTFEKLDLAKMRREALYHHDMVRRAAADPSYPSFDPAGADYPIDAASMIDMDDFALAPGGLVDSLGLTAASRTLLEGDRAAAAAAKATLDGGGTLSSGQISDLRTCALRLLCLASTMYTEDNCGLF